MSRQADLCMVFARAMLVEARKVRVDHHRGDFWILFAIAQKWRRIAAAERQSAATVSKMETLTAIGGAA